MSPTHRSPSIYIKVSLPNLEIRIFPQLWWPPDLRWVLNRLWGSSWWISPSDILFILSSLAGRKIQNLKRIVCHASWRCAKGILLGVCKKHSAERIGRAAQPKTTSNKNHIIEFDAEDGRRSSTRKRKGKKKHSKRERKTMWSSSRTI